MEVCREKGVEHATDETYLWIVNFFHTLEVGDFAVAAVVCERFVIQDQMPEMKDFLRE